MVDHFETIDRIEMVKREYLARANRLLDLANEERRKWPRGWSLKHKLFHFLFGPPPGMVKKAMMYEEQADVLRSFALALDEARK